MFSNPVRNGNSLGVQVNLAANVTSAANITLAVVNVTVAYRATTRNLPGRQK